jgi:4-amino-4-deoxy-L-arabinose transferase-like glycosyltransferase
MNTDSRKDQWARSLLAALAALHIVLAIAYATVTPYRTPGYLSMFKTNPWKQVADIGAPDERAHVNYVLNILHGDGLPVYKIMIPDPAHPGLSVRNPKLEEMYEDHQAPLFYLLDAGFGKMVGLDAISATDRSQGVRLRYLNALFGAGTVLGVYFLALWGLMRRDVALLASGITALLPMNLALSGAVSNDPLLFCICSWALAVCALGINRGWNSKRYLALGALVGLGLLTKTTALALIPLVILAFLLKRPSAKGAVACAVLAVVIVLPWFVRNQQLYGDPIGLRSFQELFAGELSTRDFISGVSGTPANHWFNYVGWFTARSFFGVFGYMDIFLNERGVAYTGPATDFGPAAPNTIYRLLLALTAVAAIGFLASLSKPESRADRRTHVLNGAFLALITALFVRYNISFFQGQARYFYPAIGPIAIGLAIGAIYLAKSKRNLVIGSIVALLLVLNGYALWRLPSEFGKRMNPTLANQVSLSTHLMNMGSPVEMRPVRASRRLE